MLVLKVIIINALNQEYTWVRAQVESCQAGLVY